MAMDVSFERAVTAYMGGVAVTLREGMTMEEAVGRLRAAHASVGAGAGQQAMYFYVVNEEEQLVGVLAARTLLLAPAGERVGERMVRCVVTLSPRDTLFDALELFAMHRLLAIPVVDDQKRVLGVLDVSLYTDEVFDFAQHQKRDEIFQRLGLRLEQYKQGSAWRGFRARMPWLLANITGGLTCAALGALFETTVQRAVIVALFIPLILTLAESVSVQSMTLAIEEAVTTGKTRGGLMREVATAILLGLCSGAIVALLTLAWRDRWMATVTIGAAVTVVMVLAAALGRAVPALIHGLKLNPRIASGPITLAVVDVTAITVYMTAATFLL
ncbi:MAG TPA: magnesium transporter [Phycisphaerae bacterium]|nr:magnesium transporter [Phycisphaerae bacterium]